LEIDAKGGEILGESVGGDALLILWGKGEANKISHLLGVCKDRFHFGILLTLLKAPIYVPPAPGSCSFSLRVFPQGLSSHGTSVLLCLTKH